MPIDVRVRARLSPLGLPDLLGTAAPASSQVVRGETLTAVQPTEGVGEEVAERWRTPVRGRIAAARGEGDVEGEEDKR